jgi:hypothetical protein
MGQISGEGRSVDKAEELGGQEVWSLFSSAVDAVPYRDGDGMSAAFATSHPVCHNCFLLSSSNHAYGEGGRVDNGIVGTHAVRTAADSVGV